MTPEKARELRDKAAPGPWRNYDDPDMDGQIVYDAEGIEVAEQLSLWDAELVTLAPALAELVAGLRYEYAVQKLDGNEWKLTDLDGRALESYESEKVTWWSDPIPQSDIADRGPGWRVVRRLAGDPEVVE